MRYLGVLGTMNSGSVSARTETVMNTTWSTLESPEI